MSLVEYEINRRDFAIEAIRRERDIAWNTIAGLQSNNAALLIDKAALLIDKAALQNQIEEYKRRYGQLNGKMI
ncbi:MAG: hypothetical protein FWH18_09100 [Marinilabiliaceae bacterium]|nr:hypothetical protein [Marinilabiliaceae bacterium]